MSPQSARARVQVWLLRGARLEKDDRRGRRKRLRHFGDLVMYDISAVGPEKNQKHERARALLGAS
eukprot:8900148-Lingulodinium_polyedra.AAC.1